MLRQLFFSSVANLASQIWQKWKCQVFHMVRKWMTDADFKIISPWTYPHCFLEFICWWSNVVGENNRTLEKKLSEHHTKIVLHLSASWANWYKTSCQALCYSFASTYSPTLKQYCGRILHIFTLWGEMEFSKRQGVPHLHNYIYDLTLLTRLMHNTYIIHPNGSCFSTID